MAFRIPFSLVLAVPFIAAAASRPITFPDNPPIQYKSFPSATLAAACGDCGSVVAIDHEYGADAGVLVHLRMDDGSERVVRRSAADDIAVGARVHLSEGRVRRY